MDWGQVSATIRPYRIADRDDVYDVCVRTGAAGQDARGRYSTDELLGDIYAGPYLQIAPEHAYVLDNGVRAVGYVIGTPDTREFVTAYRVQWLPRLTEIYEPPSAVPTSEEESKLADMFRPELMLLPELARYPAHLHINLLPDYQGAGHGRALVATFLASVAAVGARWCYLVVRASNAGALRFYDKLGWRRIEVAEPGPSIFLVKPTG
jgi:ribosomal protein S18 acetylase RimI-like enzyme